MTTLQDAASTATGPRSRAALTYGQITKQLVDAAKQPGFSAQSWAPLGALLDIDEFVRIGPFKDVMNWVQYTEFLTNWAMSSEWDCSFQRITETPDVVFLELEERSTVGDFSSVVNTVSVYEFGAEDKIRRVAVYLQMEMPDSAAIPGVDERGKPL